LGVSNHEEPRIIVDAPMVLEPGMVIALEPAVYVEGFGGVRQERMILVTRDGAELLTNNSFELA
jgi:Xaa-Pro aminopeptidase